MSTHPSSVRHRGRRSLVSVSERGAGEPLVLLHGLGTTRQIWSLVTEPLARHHRRVVTLDLPGFGESAPVGDGFDLGEVTDRLARALAAHQVTAPFDLVGHSLGGATLSPDQARMMVEASASAQRIAEAISTIATSDLLPRLGQTPAPLGLIWGRRDKAVPFKLAADILAVRSDAELEVIDWTGHVPMVERPDSFVVALLNILERLDKDATRSAA